MRFGYYEEGISEDAAVNGRIKSNEQEHLVSATFLIAVIAAVIL